MFTQYIETEYLTHEERIIERIKHSKEDIHSYVFPTTKYDVAPESYANMEKGVKIFQEHVQRNSNITILVDVDVDGYTSASMLRKLCKEELGVDDVHIIHHENKLHGLYDSVIEEIVATECDLLFLPDSSSNDCDELLYLMKYMDIIVIDHHDISNNDYYELEKLGGLALINNQSITNINSNTHLTGSGMTLRFIECFYNRVGQNNPDFKYYDLAMLGLIGDMADYSDYEIRNIVFTGLDNIHNQLVKTILEDKLNKEYYTPKDIAFVINPLINATTRVGYIEDKHLVFDALSCNINRSITEKRRRKINNKFQQVDVTFNFYEYAYDSMTKLKGKQDRLVKKLEEELEVDDSLGIAIGFIDADYKGITGLVANKIASQVKKPTLLLRDGGNINGLTGSGRGYEKTMDDFKQWCQETEAFQFAEGHDNAFGVGILESNLDKVYEKAQQVKIPEQKHYYVDEIFNSDNPLRFFDIQQYESLNYLTGGSIPEIRLGIETTITDDMITVYGSVTKIILDSNIELIIFQDNGYMGTRLLEMATSEGFVTIKAVGTPNINRWLYKTTGQIVVDDIIIVEG